MGKVCSKCGVEKDTESFNKHKEMRDGLRPECKDCEKEYKRQYLQKNKHEISIKQRRYRKENKDKIASQTFKSVKEYRKKHPERVKSWDRAGKIKRKSKIKEYKKTIIESLAPPYMRGLLKRIGFTNAVIDTNPELIEVYKQIVKIKRLCKTKSRQ